MLLTQDFSSNVDELCCSAVCSGSSWLLLGPSLCAQAVGTELDRSWVLSEQQSASPCLPASLPACLPPCLHPSLLKALLPAGTAAHSGLFVALVSCRAPWCPRCAVLDGAVRSSACGCSPSWQRVVLSDFCL